MCVRVVVQKNKWFDVKEQKSSQVNQAKWQAAKSIKLKNNGMSNIKKQGWFEVSCVSTAGVIALILSPKSSHTSENH